MRSSRRFDSTTEVRHGARRRVAERSRALSTSAYNGTAMLNQRKAAILKAVVEQYIASAQPVGSSRVASSAQISVSSATIRNDMTALEREGFLAQPHTSAGRVPTEKGYRFFVDHLGDGASLPPHQAKQVGQFFAHTHGELEQMLRSATSLLARLTHTAAVVVSNPETAAVIRSAQLVPLSDTHLLVVVVLSDGSIVKSRVDLDEPAGDQLLSDANAALARHLAGRSVLEMLSAETPADLADRSVLELVGRVLAHLSVELAEDHTTMFVDGASNIARQFDGGGLLGEILELLEQQLVVVGLLRELMDRQVSVAIGSEHGIETLSECSLVLAPVVAGDTRAGTVAVLGPTRMNYRETLAAVAVVSDRLGRALTDKT